MRIGVLSDTHSRQLPPQVLEAFSQVDLIIHAGDFCALADYQDLKRIRPVEAVSGNMDAADLARQLPHRKIINCEGIAIGIFHGEGAPRFLLSRVQDEFSKEDVAAVVFGHSHHPVNEKKGNILFFNPGSPTDTIFAPYRSYGILEVSKQGISGQIIRLKD